MGPESGCKVCGLHFTFVARRGRQVPGSASLLLAKRDPPRARAARPAPTRAATAALCVASEVPRRRCVGKCPAPSRQSWHRRRCRCRRVDRRLGDDELPAGTCVLAEPLGAAVEFGRTPCARCVCDLGDPPRMCRHAPARAEKAWKKLVDVGGDSPAPAFGAVGGCMCARDRHVRQRVQR